MAIATGKLSPSLLLHAVFVYPWFGRQGHGSIRRVFLRQSTRDEVKKRQSSGSSCGNAPVMRCLPAALLGPRALPSDRQHVAATLTEVTHPHVHGNAAALSVALGASAVLEHDCLWSDILRSAIAGLQLAPQRFHDKAALEYLRQVDKLPDYHTLPRGMRDMDLSVLCRGRSPFGSRRIDGMPCDALVTAGMTLYMLKHHRTPIDTLRQCLLVGGDVDSLAAVCLGVVAGKEGLQLDTPDGIPSSLVHNLEGVDYLINMATMWEQWYKQGCLVRVPQSSAS